MWYCQGIFLVQWQTFDRLLQICDCIYHIEWLGQAMLTNNSNIIIYLWIHISCTPDKEICGFSLGEKFCSYPGVLVQANYINALQFYSAAKGNFLVLLCKKKESNMEFCCRWAFPILGMTVLRTEPHIRVLYYYLYSFFISLLI